MIFPARLLNPIRKILGVTVASLGLTAGAYAANDQPLALVEFASFDCPHCQAMSQHHTSIQAAVEAAGLEYRYAPLPSHTGLERAWRERAFYASRSIPGVADDVRKAFLAAGETGVPLKDYDDVLAHLQLHVPQVRWNEFADDHISDPSSVEAIERAARLAGRAGLREYPAFVAVSRSEVKLLSLSGDVAERAEAVIKYLENL